MRRRHLFAASALAALVPAGAAVASAPPDTSAGSAAPGDSGAAPATTPTDASTPDAAGDITVYNDEGEAVATIAVGSTEPGWTDYGGDDAPDEGMEYFRATVTVTSMMPEGTFAVAIDDFVLQDAHGFLDTADNVRTAAQVDSDEEVVEEAELANGESVELGLTFEVDPTIGAQSVFYHPDDDQLVDVAEVA